MCDSRAGGSLRIEERDRDVAAALGALLRAEPRLGARARVRRRALRRVVDAGVRRRCVDRAAHPDLAHLRAEHVRALPHANPLPESGRGLAAAAVRDGLRRVPVGYCVQMTLMTWLLQVHAGEYAAH